MHLRTCTMHLTVLCRSPSNNTHGTLSVYQSPRRLLKVSRIQRTPNVHVRCTCTMHPTPLLHTAPSRHCQGVPMYRVWCHWLKVSLNRRTPRQKYYPPATRAAYSPQERHPQWILSWYSMHVSCEFRVGGAPRLTCRCVRFFFSKPLTGRHVPRATC